MDRFQVGCRVRYFSVMYPRMNEKGVTTVRAIGPMHEGGEVMLWLDGVRGAWHPDACELVEEKA